MDTQGIGGSECQYRDGDRSTGHVDGCSQRDGNCVGIGVETQTPAQSHINRDVSSRAAGEEGIYARFADGGPYQRIRVAVDVEVDDEWIHYQCYQEVRCNEYAQKVHVADDGRKAAVADRGGNQAHNAERGKVDDPFYY